MNSIYYIDDRRQGNKEVPIKNIESSWFKCEIVEESILTWNNRDKRKFLRLQITNMCKRNPPPLLRRINGLTFACRLSSDFSGDALWSIYTCCGSQRWVPLPWIRLRCSRRDWRWCITCGERQADVCRCRCSSRCNMRDGTGRMVTRRIRQGYGMMVSNRLKL